MLTIEEIRAALAGRNLTQTAQSLGVTRQTLHNIISGRNQPSYALLVKLARMIEAEADRG